MAVVLVILLLFGFAVILFSFLSPIVAVVLIWLGVLLGLPVVYLAMSREPLHKDVERLKRDTDRRAHVPAFGGGHGVLFFEDGGPTKPNPQEEEY